MVQELNLSLVGIPDWFQFGDFTLKLKDVRDVLKTVLKQTKRQMDGEHFFSPPTRLIVENTCIDV